jgi:hypothetical protein
VPGKRGARQVRVPKQGLQFNVLREFTYHLARAALLAVVPGFVAISATFTMFVMSALPPINSARSEVINSEVDYFNALRGTEPVLSELEQLGAPSDQIQVVYFSFIDAEGDEARRMADTYLGVLIDQGMEARSRAGPGANRIPMLLGPANSARRRAGQAYQQWTTLLAAPSGRLALWFGLVQPPTIGMMVYQREHPR